MKYQIITITLNHGNAVFLPHGMEIAADSIKEAGAKVAENMGELGLKVIAVKAIHKADVTEEWEPEPEKPNLFNANGADSEALPKRRGPGRPKKVLAIPDMWDRTTSRRKD
jgi:hypothetical protein